MTGGTVGAGATSDAAYALPLVLLALTGVGFWAANRLVHTSVALSSRRAATMAQRLRAAGQVRQARAVRAWSLLRTASARTATFAVAAVGPAVLAFVDPSWGGASVGFAFASVAVAVPALARVVWLGCGTRLAGREARLARTAQRSPASTLSLFEVGAAYRGTHRVQPRHRG